MHVKDVTKYSTIAPKGARECNLAFLEIITYGSYTSNNESMDHIHGLSKALDISFIR